MSDGIAKVDGNAGTLMRQATDVAGVVGEGVKRTARNIQGRKYVQVEGWQSIAVAYGCIASARDVRKLEGGIAATGEVRRMADGALLATAEGFVGDDETMWAKRPEYARRAMAQTRAISRACRSAFAFVVTLIDGDLSTTPAEEVPPEGFDVVAPSRDEAVAALKKHLGSNVAPSRQTVDAPRSSPPQSNLRGMLNPMPVNFPNFGRAKGQPIAGADEKDLKFYIGAAEKSLADASKERFHAKERAALAAYRAELMSRSADAEDDGQPPHTDDDMPH